jgi:hypothetical protein
MSALNAKLLPSPKERLGRVGWTRIGFSARRNFVSENCTPGNQVMVEIGENQVTKMF